MNDRAQTQTPTSSTHTGTKQHSTHTHTRLSHTRHPRAFRRDTPGRTHRYTATLCAAPETGERPRSEVAPGWRSVVFVPPASVSQVCQSRARRVRTARSDHQTAPPPRRAVRRPPRRPARQRVGRKPSPLGRAPSRQQRGGCAGARATRWSQADRVGSRGRTSRGRSEGAAPERTMNADPDVRPRLALGSPLVRVSACVSVFIIVYIHSHISHITSYTRPTLVVAQPQRTGRARLKAHISRP